MKLPQDHPEIVVYFIVGLLLFWLGFGMSFFNEGGRHESRAEIAITLSISACFILGGLMLFRKIARLFHAESVQSKQANRQR